MNKISLSIFSIFVLGIFSGIKAFACSCSMPTNEPLSVQVKKATKQANAVFTAEVLEINEDSEKGFTSVKLKVQDVWKGTLTKEITLLTGIHDGNCRFPFMVKKRYLIYANNGTMYSSVKSFETTICDRTKILPTAKADINILGKRGYSPVR